MFVLLKFYNDYDQHGGYFAGLFDSEILAEQSVDHIGRRDAEYSWYEIKGLAINVIYNNEGDE